MLLIAIGEFKIDLNYYWISRVYLETQMSVTGMNRYKKSLGEIKI